MSRRTPPRCLEARLERRLGDRLQGQSTVGDLAEAYHRMRSRRPGWMCDLWYVGQSVTLYVYGAQALGRPAVGDSLPARAGGAGADLQWALRVAVRRPFFAAGVALTLGLGLGATSAVFSVTHGTFRATSWWADSERVMALWPGKPFSRGQLSFLIQDTGAAFEAVGAYKLEAFAISRAGGEPQSVNGAVISPELFERLRVQPVLGRGLTVEDAVPGAEPSVVLSRRFWLANLGGDPAVVGQRLEVNGERRTVIGVQGEGGSAPGAATDAWLPLVLDPADPEFFPTYDLDAVGVARPGVSVADALVAMKAFARGMSVRFPFFYRSDFGQDGTVELGAAEQRAALRTPLFLLLGATVVLLLVSAVNVGNMVLARALERTREIAVRRALGASRYQVVRQLAIESALLALLGGVTGALLAAPAARLLTGLWAADAPVARSGWTSPAVLLFSIAAGALTWLALAGPPIVHFAAADARGVRANVSTPPRRALNVLVGTQAALATVLLAFAVLLVASVGSLRRIPLGFDPEAVTAFRLSPPADLLTDPDRLRQLQEQVLARVRSLPGVDAAGLASHAPLGGVPIRMPVNAEDRPVDVAEAPRVPRYAVDPGFFETVRVQLLGGRALDASDRGGRVSAVVVNRALAEALWPGQDPVGKLIAIDPHAWSSWVTVVGVVENLRSETITGAPGPAFYVSLAEQLERETTLLVRGRVALASLAAEVRRVVTDVDPSVAVGAVRPLPLIVRGAYGTAWVTMGLLAVLALLATGLAALGIHAALSHDVVLRRREIALRLALGAKRASVVGRVLAAGLLPTTVGIAAGLLVALLAGGVLESLLFGVRSGDLRALLATASTVLLAALAAAAVSALRVGGLPPAEVLREE